MPLRFLRRGKQDIVLPKTIATPGLRAQQGKEQLQMPSSISRRAFLSGTTAGLATLAIGEGQQVAAATSGILRIDLPGHPGWLTPWEGSSLWGTTVRLLIHRGLLSYDRTGTLRGELAQSWTADGANAWIFKLHEARFHDGSPVTSADVKWSIEQAFRVGNYAHFIGHFRNIAEVETPDEKTVRLVMEKQFSLVPEWFAHHELLILPAKGDPKGRIGAGPFRLRTEDLYATSYELEAFPGYYKPNLPKLKGIDIRFRTSKEAFREAARLGELAAGEADLTQYVIVDTMQPLADSSDLTIDVENAAFLYLIFNGSKPPFDNPKVRKAVAHAIHRDDIVAALSGPSAPLNRLPLDKASPYFNADLKHGWTHDPELSKKLLAEAGLPAPIVCKLSAREDSADWHKQVAEVCRTHLAAVGVTVELEIGDIHKDFDFAVAEAMPTTYDPDQWSLMLDAYRGPPFHLSPFCSFRLPTPEIENRLAAARSEFDPAKRKALYREIEQLTIEQAPIVTLAWRRLGHAMRKSVKGFQTLPAPLYPYSALTLEEAELA
jgi:peptide/nickel transport system substrate-binding protein